MNGLYHQTTVSYTKLLSVYIVSQNNLQRNVICCLISKTIFVCKFVEKRQGEASLNLITDLCPDWTVQIISDPGWCDICCFGRRIFLIVYVSAEEKKVLSARTASLFHLSDTEDRLLCSKTKIDWLIACTCCCTSFSGDITGNLHEVVSTNEQFSYKTK